MRSNRKGFSLVEMSIVLIIFGLVLASATSILSLFVNKGGAERTRKMLEANKNAMYSIAAAYGTYYDPNETAIDVADEYQASLSYPNDAYGVAFFITLDDTMIKYFSASPTVNKTNLDYSPVCAADSTNTKLEICDNALCDTGNTVIDNVAFVIASAGQNKNTQTSVQTETISSLDYDYVRVYIQGTDVVGDLGRTEGYDDIVDWVTLPELRAKAGCDANRLSFLDTEMPIAAAGDTYSYNIYPKGGVPHENSSDSSVEEYKFVLDNDDGLLTGTSITMEVYDDTGSKVEDIQTSQAAANWGSYLHFTGNTAAADAGESYRVEVTIYDDSSAVSNGSDNSVTRTLYIRVQD